MLELLSQVIQLRHTPSKSACLAEFTGALQGLFHLGGVFTPQTGQYFGEHSVINIAPWNRLCASPSMAYKCQDFPSSTIAKVASNRSKRVIQCDQEFFQLGQSLQPGIGIALTLKVALQIDVPELQCEGAIEDFIAERMGRLIHIHGASDEEI